MRRVALYKAEPARRLKVKICCDKVTRFLWVLPQAQYQEIVH